MSEKIQNSFYLLKDSITIPGKGISKATVQVIDDAYIGRLMKLKNYKPQKVTPNLHSQYEISLYFRKKTSDIRWKEFIKSIAVANEPILKQDKTTSESYILILKSKKGNCYYSSTGGSGHMVIQDIATNDLGLQILSRILKPEDKSLRSSKERALVGGILGAVKIFRNDHNLYENESFGSIYNELNAAVNVDKLINIFGFPPADIKADSLCIAKNSFCIKKSISFKELLRIITNCEKLLTQPPLVEINSVEKLGRGNQPLIKTLNTKADAKVYANYLDSNKFFSVEISHKDFERYYLSTYTIFYFRIGTIEYEFKSDEPIREIQTLLDEIRKIDPTVSQQDFDRITVTATIITYDSGGEIVTSDTMRNHYCTEIQDNLKSYFLIEKDWYEIGKTMIDKINENCQNFINSRTYSGPAIRPWVGFHDSENDYNASYIGKSNSMVFDKITPSNIEVCDILRWDTNHVYFYHVKKGFNNSMRDLCAQVFIAARRVQEDSKDGFKFIGQLYDTLQANQGTSAYIVNARNQLQNIQKNVFIDLFTTRNLVFVLAVLDTSVANRSLATQIDEFGSNIAKFSLNELAKNMNNQEISFQILQLS
jgi:uncharacterized protein (TIGR04141 family)